MIDSHRCWQIKHRQAHQGLHASQSARAWTLDPRTVAYWLSPEHCRPRQSALRARTLDPCTPEIVRLLAR
jgi:hypothetical protein